jgi:hypothetical protein
MQLVAFNNNVCRTNWRRIPTANSALHIHSDLDQSALTIEFFGTPLSFDYQSARSLWGLGSQQKSQQKKALHF